MLQRIKWRWNIPWAFAFFTPVVFLLLLSFSLQWIFPAVFPTHWTLQQWTGLLQNRSGLLSSLLLSLLISAVVALFATSMGFWVSRTIAVHRWRKWFTFFAYLPFTLAPLVFASVVDFYFIWLKMSGSPAGVIFAQLLITFPFALLLFVDYWDIKIKSLEDLVFTLGGNQRQAFWLVTIPVSKPLLLLCLFQTFLTSWFEYGLTTVIGAGKVQTLTVKVFQLVGEANPYYAAVSSCLLMLPPLLLLLFNKRFLFNKMK